MLVFKKSTLFSVLQFFFIFCTISFYSGAFTDHIIFGQGYGENLSNVPKIVNSLLKFPLYFFSIWIILKYFRLFRFSVADSKYLILFMFFCLVNSFFSTSVSDSLFKLFSVVMTFIVAHAFAVIILYERSIKYIATTLIILMIGSILYIYLLPEYGLMSASDNFENSGLVGEKQGVFKHKNVFGAVSAFSFLYAFYFLDKKERLRFPLLIVSVLCLLLANSATKIFAVVGIIIFVKFVYFVKAILTDRYYKFAVYFSLLTMIFIIVFSLGLMDELVGLAGRDLTFTGRTIIWSHAINVASESLIMGYGLSSIWETELGYIAELPFYIPIHSHSSFVEVLLTSGVVGVLLLMLFILACFGRFSVFMANNNSRFFLAVFLLALIDSFFEFTLFRGNSILFLVSMAAMFFLRFSVLKVKVQ